MRKTTLPGVARNENAVANCIMGKAGLLIAVLIQGKNNSFLAKHNRSWSYSGHFTGCVQGSSWVNFWDSAHRHTYCPATDMVVFWWIYTDRGIFHAWFEVKLLNEYHGSGPDSQPSVLSQANFVLTHTGTHRQTHTQTQFLYTHARTDRHTHTHI